MNINKITTDTTRVGMLRQWINEDIINRRKQVTNDELLFWLTGDKKYLEVKLTRSEIARKAAQARWDDEM